MYFCRNYFTESKTDFFSQQLVWLECPTNPCLKLYDIMAISKLAHSYGNILVAMDNSMMTPYFQRPLELGVDIVVYSVGKYISGHSDVIMGSAVMNDDKLYEHLSNVLGRMLLDNTDVSYDKFEEYSHDVKLSGYDYKK
ncbi:hypothetical protein EON73_04600, partial [bacterium]